LLSKADASLKVQENHKIFTKWAFLLARSTVGPILPAPQNTLESCTFREQCKMESTKSKIHAENSFTVYAHSVDHSVIDI